MLPFGSTAEVFFSEVLGVGFWFGEASGTCYGMFFYVLSLPFTSWPPQLILVRMRDRPRHELEFLRSTDRFPTLSRVFGPPLRFYHAFLAPPSKAQKKDGWGPDPLPPALPSLVSP